MRREIPFPRVFNFRDLGGYASRDGRAVRWRRLFRSDTLSGLADGDRDRFLGLGIRTVLDLRRPYEVERDGRVPAWDGLTYRNLDPGHPEWHLTPYHDGLEPVRYLADRYRDMAEEGAARFAEAIGMIADETAAPVVVHCVAGKDRTGVLCALTLALLDVADRDIDADYTRSAVGNRRYLEWLRANGRPDATPLAWWRAPPGTMRVFLSELRQRHGSVERYLTRAGLHTGQVTALRTHLLTTHRS
jgi:protein tyrosine/serine phosphatase